MDMSIIPHEGIDEDFRIRLIAFKRQLNIILRTRVQGP